MDFQSKIKKLYYSISEVSKITNLKQYVIRYWETEFPDLKPAKKMQLKNRGELKEKYFADIVIFDPKTVIDKATYTKPRKYPEGINYVIVNGGIALENGTRSNKTFGKILRHKV